MKKLCPCPLAVCSALLLLLTSVAAAQTAPLQLQTGARPIVGGTEKLLLHYERWRTRLDRGFTPLVIPLGWSLGRSVLFTRARGSAVLDHEAGTLTLSVLGIGDDELGGASALEAWLEPYPGSSKRRPVLLGTLSLHGGEGQLVATIDGELAALELEEIVVARSGQGPAGGPVLFGSPDLFQRMAGLELTQARKLRGREIGGVPLGPPRAASAQQRPKWSVGRLDELVAEGERLFFEETFAGNQRTCGTCHPAENNFTLDPVFIATLPADDPLFVAENDPALDSTRNGGLVFESPVHMRQFGLIVENLDGFDDLREGFVLRGVQPTLGLAATIEPQAFFNQPLRHLTGWGGDGSPGRGSLREFALGAVRQHFPKTMKRREGVDFRLPRPDELSALEGFQLSLGRTEDPRTGELAFTDAGVRRGLQAFVFQGLCNFCHIDGGGLTVGLDIGAVFIDTGVEELQQHSPDGTGLPRPVDGGFGTRPDGGFGERVALQGGGFGNGRFNVPSLIELADTLPAFHNHVTATPASGLANTVEGAVAFYMTQEFTDSEVGGGVFDLGLTARDIADIGRFLRVLNALENLRTVGEYTELALAESSALARPDTETRVQRLIQLALLENEDAVQVLAEVGLHPAVQAELRAIEEQLLLARAAEPAERTLELQGIRARLEHARALMVG